jgi:hypothetical protein
LRAVNGRLRVQWRPETERQLERLEWYLRHGNAFRAFQVVEDLEDDLLGAGAEQTKPAKALRELGGCVRANGAWIPNAGDRSRHAAPIASAFVESTVDQVVSKREEPRSPRSRGVQRFHAPGTASSVLGATATTSDGRSISPARTVRPDLAP